MRRLFSRWGRFGQSICQLPYSQAYKSGHVCVIPQQTSKLITFGFLRIAFDEKYTLRSGNNVPEDGVICKHGRQS